MPPLDLSDPNVLDSIEKTKDIFDKMVKEGKMEIDTDAEGNIDIEKVGEQIKEQLKYLFGEEVESIDPEMIHDINDSSKTEIDYESFEQNREDLSDEDDAIKNDKKSDKKIPKFGFSIGRPQGRGSREKKRTIDEYGINLNEQAKSGKIDKVVGRTREIDRVIEILNRRNKNNPCLIGEPGVGKTAIAQGLALKIVEGDVPYKLMDKKIYLLDMGTLVAGTQFRGQFESRIKSIVKDCIEDPNIIIVIDEVHTIVGNGESDGSTNAANILKPSLSRGDIQVIGTTTLNEYRKYIEKDSALERRFQPVIVDEPSIEDTIEMLEGIKKYYEDFHKVSISSDMIRKTVEMSEKYIHNRFLPDKAIDIIDEACSRLNLNNKKLYELEMLKDELKKVQEEKEKVLEKTGKDTKEVKEEKDITEDYKLVAEFKQKECKLEEDIQKLEEELKPVPLTVDNVAKVIEKWTKIPVSKITEAETDKLIKLEENIAKRVIGHKEAVKAISKAIRRNRAGLQTTKRPPSFIFVGPTGVGKTELAKTVAYEMFGSEENIIRVDMSEYMEKYSVSKLIGSAPGYVGYGEGGQLTEKVRRNPYSIILFDEIEKAHPDVFNLLLQVLDDARLTDSEGRVVNFENTIIIMTSNAGSTLNTNAIGFGNENEVKKEKILSAVRETFRPEFLNRIDEVIVFEALTNEDIEKILDIFLRNTQKALDRKNMKLEVTKTARKYIIKNGTDLKYGARPLRRAVQRYVEDNIAEDILLNKVHEGKEVVVDLVKNKEGKEEIVILEK
ncbi:MAG: ATP-dependent Clp protease ATP-binding subunit [Clostridiales bacterium]|nr:ATP-dependent Clp protease ATP-binding subunit [Clostridiales bacterium]